MPIEVAHGLPDSNQIFLSLPQNMFNNMGNPVGTLVVNLADALMVISRLHNSFSLALLAALLVLLLRF
jgi:hypothetical protein